MAKIVIDNGHGYDTAGKRTPAFPTTGKVIREWEFNHPTARMLKEMLESDGHEVLMASDTTRDTPLSQRTKKANDWGADLVISIHYNAYKGVWGTHGGIETLYHVNSKEGKALADLVQKYLIGATKLRDRGIKSRPASGPGSLAILSNTRMPAILVECGFMDNLEEAHNMLDASYQRKCATAIRKGINAHLKHTTTTPPAPPAVKEPKLMVLGIPAKMNSSITDGTTYMKVGKLEVPVRELFEGMGFKVDWEKETSTIIIEEGK